MTPRAAAVALALVAVAPAARADVPNAALVCPADPEVLDPVRLLRALSLDLRGRLPEPAEVDAVMAEGAVPEALVDEWLGSAEFQDQVVRQHRALLWLNITNQTLLSFRTAFAKTGQVYWRRGVAKGYRGDEVPCLDVPATTTSTGEIATVTQPDGTTLEGFVMVAPYWDPANPIKVCAFDAQDQEVSASGNPCGTQLGLSDPGCGCGPALRWCRYGASHQPVLEAMAGDVERRIARVVAEDAPYVELFTSPVAYVNGPLAHYFRWQTGVPANLSVEPSSLPMDQVPDLAFTDKDTWVQVQLGPEHAGILTSPAYLLRFQTNRARANRFYNAFLCQPFQPPPGGIPVGEGAQEPDLQKRPGCKYCHALLEPSASYWGRWTQNGAGWLAPEEWTPFRQDCATCATTGFPCSAECKAWYVTKALSPEEAVWLGWMKPYEFRAPEHVHHIDEGPRLLALRAVVDDRLPTCVARSAAEWLLGRPVTADEAPWLTALANGFVADGLRYRGLVKAIVTSDVYRRVR